MTKKKKTPWPTKAVMQQVYEKHLWGGAHFDFYSGEGSYKPEIIEPYLNAITSFLESHDNALTICDLGCGDFNIGQHLVEYTKKYIAIDIVDEIIERNKKRYRADHLEFQCLDISKDKLPDGDCIILRQVLQHLSNAEIKRIVNILSNYKYIILTEHLPLNGFMSNKDIISGQGIRLRYNSGVDLLKPPFYLNVKEERCLDEYIDPSNKKGKIKTTLYIL